MALAVHMSWSVEMEVAALQWTKTIRPVLGPALLIFLAFSCGPIWAAQSKPQPSGGDEKATLAASDKLTGKGENSTGSTGARAVNPPVDPASYVVGAEGETLDSRWREPELTLSVVVRPDGMISMPLLNDVKATVGLKPLATY